MANRTSTTAPSTKATHLPPAVTGRRQRASWARRLLAAAAAMLIVGAAVGYWGLNRYVIDHVEIDDVAAFEAAASQSPSSQSQSSQSPAQPSSATSTTTGRPSIDVSTVVVGEGNDRVTYYVAHVRLGDGTQRRGGFAENKFGRNIVQDTSDMAASYDAVFAINGDYYGFRGNGITIRNGVLYRDEGARTGLAMYRDGTAAIYDERTTTGRQLLADGVWNTVSFGPALVDNGEIVKGIESIEIDNNFGLRSIQGNNPRTGIGVIEPNHFVFVVVDGRSRGYSRGVTMTELAQILKDVGATVAYNLDGGGSSTMYFNGSVVNKPLGNGDERAISDILYIA